MLSALHRTVSLTPLLQRGSLLEPAVAVAAVHVAEGLLLEHLSPAQLRRGAGAVPPRRTGAAAAAPGTPVLPGAGAAGGGAGRRLGGQRGSADDRCDADALAVEGEQRQVQLRTTLRSKIKAGNTGPSSTLFPRRNCVFFLARPSTGWLARAAES